MSSTGLFLCGIFLGIIIGFLILPFIIIQIHKKITGSSLPNPMSNNPHVLEYDVHLPPNASYSGGYTPVKVCFICSSIEQVVEGKENHKCFNCNVFPAEGVGPGRWDNEINKWISRESNAGLTPIK